MIESAICAEKPPQLPAGGAVLGQVDLSQPCRSPIVPTDPEDITIGGGVEVAPDDHRTVPACNQAVDHHGGLFEALPGRLQHGG